MQRAGKLLRSGQHPRLRSVYTPTPHRPHSRVETCIIHLQSLLQPLGTRAIGMSTTAPASGKSETPVPPGFAKTGEKVRDMFHTLDYIGILEFNGTHTLISLRIQMNSWSTWRLYRL